jgi:hypothetical protein
MADLLYNLLELNTDARAYLRPWRNFYSLEVLGPLGQEMRMDVTKPGRERALPRLPVANIETLNNSEFNSELSSKFNSKLNRAGIQLAH